MEKAGGQGEAVEMEKPGGQGEAAGLDKTGDDKAVRLFNTKKSVLAYRARHCIYYDGKFLCYNGWILHLLGLKVALLIWSDTTFTRMGSVLANYRAGYFIYYDGKCPC